MSEETKYVNVRVIIMRETQKAFLVEAKGNEVWLPKSQIENHSDYGAGDDCDIRIAEWLAQKDDLI